jgi:hypothetical protein
MQKTLTIKGEKFTSQQIAKKMLTSPILLGGDYELDLNGELFYATFRRYDDLWYVTCSPERATCIQLTPAITTKHSIWMEV